MPGVDRNAATQLHTCAYFEGYGTETCLKAERLALSQFRGCKLFRIAGGATLLLYRSLYNRAGKRNLSCHTLHSSRMNVLNLFVVIELVELLECIVL